MQTLIHYTISFLLATAIFLAIMGLIWLSVDYPLWAMALVIFCALIGFTHGLKEVFFG